MDRSGLSFSVFRCQRGAVAGLIHGLICRETAFALGAELLDNADVEVLLDQCLETVRRQPGDIEARSLGLWRGTPMLS